jgi:hypothetical protein
VVLVGGGEVVVGAVGGAVACDDGALGDAIVGALVGDGVPRAVVDVVISAVVAGDETAGVVEGVVVGAVAGGVAADPVAPALPLPRLPSELAIGPAIIITHTAKTPTTAAAPPNKRARQPGLASATVTSRVRRPRTPARRSCSTRGVSWVMTLASKASLDASCRDVCRREFANDVPMAVAISATEVNGCSGCFSMARHRVPNRSWSSSGRHHR